MRRRSKGQSLVEMALMLPLLMLVLFGIIDLGYYIYSYATVYEAARNGSEVAAQLPPFASALGPPAKADDDCVRAILNATEKGAVLFPDISNYVTISYPSGSTRALGKPIQVVVNYTIEPLTPLFKFVTFGNKGVMTVNVTARRSIENLGNTPPTEEHPNGVACKNYP
jgi:TadE-like protein